MGHFFLDFRFLLPPCSCAFFLEDEQIFSQLLCFTRAREPTADQRHANVIPMAQLRQSSKGLGAVGIINRGHRYF